MSGSIDAVLSYQSAILAALIGVAGVVLSVLMSLIVVKIQTKSASKNLDRQLSMDIRKLELEYELKNKAESKRYVNQLLLEKATELQAIYPKWIRMCWKSAERQNDYFKLKEKSKEEYLKMRKEVDEIEVGSLNLIRQISILFNYFPGLNKEFDKVSMFNTKHFIIDITELIKKEEVTEVEIQSIDVQIRDFQLQATALGELIDSEIISTLNKF